ncbi:MAG: molybdopterin-guanine dinucleotide biosynthesis protein B [Anaerolineae bacterium]
MRRLFSIVGWHNAGKTTLAEGLVREYRKRGARVAVIKHSREGFDIDHPGTDTWRLTEAGSDVVVIASKNAMAWLERPAQELSLEQIVKRLDADIDVVIGEGFKHERGPKIEVLRLATGTEPIASADELLAIVTDDVTDPRPVPGFGFQEIVRLVDFLMDRGYGPRSRA